MMMHHWGTVIATATRHPGELTTTVQKGEQLPLRVSNVKQFSRECYLTPSDFRTDKSVRKRRPAVTFVRGLCDRNMGLLPASSRHFTVSLHEVFTCFRSAAGSHFTDVYQRKKSGL